MKEVKSLMAITHAGLLLDLLCAKEEYAGLKDFRAQLIRLSGKDMTVTSKSDQMYLYMLTSLGLMENLGGRVAIYRRTVNGETLCKHRKRESDKYKNILKHALLNSHPANLFFPKLMKIIETGVKEHHPVAIAELDKRYGFTKETIRTLRSLGKEAGLFVERDEHLVTDVSSAKPVTLQQFVQEVLAVYDSFIEDKRRQGIPTRTAFAKISDIRSLTCAMLDISKEEFDALFSRMLTETKEGRKMDIFGAAPQYLPEREADVELYEKMIFRHNGKIYVFMSM